MQLSSIRNTRGSGPSPITHARGLSSGTPYTCGYPANSRAGRKSSSEISAVDPGLLDVVHHLPLAYEPVAGQCQLMSCGDAVYRRWVVHMRRRDFAGPGAPGPPGKQLLHVRYMHVPAYSWVPGDRGARRSHGQHGLTSCPIHSRPLRRSTLDPVLRKEVGGPDWKAFALLGAIGAYMFATPGVCAHARPAPPPFQDRAPASCAMRMPVPHPNST